MGLGRKLRVQGIVLVAAGLQILTALFAVSILVTPTATSAVNQTIPYLINFQGRLTDNNGNVLPDGSYNIKFRIFNASTGGTNEWEADRVYGTSDHRVTVENGLFNIQFGDTSQGDPTLSPSLFSGTYPLYLEVELPTPASATCASNGCAVWTEGAMTPRQSLASSPYAFNADTLDGIDSTAFGQLSTANSWTAANSFTPSSGVAITLTPAASTDSLDVKNSSGATQAYFDSNGILNVGQTIQDTTTTVDLGTSANPFRSGYFGTSVQTPALNATSSGGTITTNAGTIQNSTSSTGMTIDLKSSSNTTLTVTNSGTGTAGVSVEGGLTIGTGQTYDVGSSTGEGVTCSSGQILNAIAVTGGVVTSGSCVAAGGGDQMIGEWSSATAGATTNQLTTVQFTGAANSTPSFSNSLHTLTLPSNASRIVVETKGAGGGGGSTGSATAYLGGGGGGEGGYSKVSITNSLATNYYFNIGASGSGGAGSLAAGQNGSPGGNTCFGTNSSNACTTPSAEALGGSGGALSDTAGAKAGGAGGTTSGASGDVTTGGAPGCNSTGVANAAQSGCGGGQGGGVGIASVTAVGNNGVNGGGGSGAMGEDVATTEKAGGAGGAGYVTVTVYVTVAGTGNPATLQSSYSNDTGSDDITLSSSHPLIVRDNSTPLGTNLFEVQDNAGANNYFAVSSSGISTNGTATAATVNATSGYQANGTAGTGVACGAGTVNEAATYTEGLLTTAGTCTAVQAAGNYIVQAPVGTANTITAASGAQDLVLKGTNGTGTDLLDIYNTAVSPVLTSYFDNNGAFHTTTAISAPTSTNTINSLIINGGAVSGVTGYTQGSGSFSDTSANTTTDAADFADSSFATAASGSANLLGGSFTAGSTNATGTASTNGLSISPTVNTSGNGTKNINAINVAAPAVTACTTGTCQLDGLRVNTIASGAASNITSYGLDVEATGIGAGTLYGLNVSNITGGSGTETALNLGSGWDNLLTYTGSTVIINGSGQLNGAQLSTGTVANGALANSTIGVTAGTGLTGGSGSIALGGSTSLSVDQTASLSWTGIEQFNKSGGVAVQLNGTAASAGAQLLFGSVTGLNGGSTSGTYIGANPASYAGDFINLAINSVNKLKVDNSGNLTAAGTVTAPTIDATGANGFSANGSAGQGVTCGAGTVNEAAAYTAGILTTAGTCTSVQAAGSYLVQAPSSTATNTIAPTGVGTTGLIVQQTSTASPTADIFDVDGTSSATKFLQITGTGTANQGAIILASQGATNGLTLQSASGQVTLGTSTSLTGSGALTVESTGTNALTLATQGAANVALSPNTTGIVTVGGTTPTISGNTTLTLQSAAGDNINISPGTTGVVVVGGTTPTVTAASATNLAVDTTGGAQLNLGASNATTINIGNTASATNIIGGTAANAINLAPTTNGGIFGATTGTGVVEFDSGAGIIEQSTTNNTQAFQIQNSGGVSMLNIDTSTGAAQNLLSDSGFEKNPTTNWTNLATGSFTRVTTQAYNDFASAEETTGTAAGNGIEEVIGTILATNTTYTFSFYAKADTSTPDITDLQAGYSSAGTTGGEANCTLNSTTVITAGWMRYICTFTTSGTAPVAGAFMYIDHSGGVNDVFYIDAAQLETGSFASPYGQGQLNLNATINSPVNFQETANSTTAFQITNTIGTNILDVDTFDNNQNNQATNPSFETGMTGWAAKTGCTLTQDNTTAYNGSSSAKCVNTATASAGMNMTGISPVMVSGTTYTLALYAKASANMTTFEIGYSNNGTTDTPCLTAQSLTSLGWKRYTCTFTAAAQSGTPYVYAKQTDATVRTIWVDAVTLETDANASTNYRDGRISLGNATISSPAVFQTNTNSSTAFQVQNAGGIQVFDIDTASDPDLVANSGFEVNSVGWATMDGATNLIRDTSKSYVGIASGKVQTAATANSGMRYTFSTQLPAVAATSYTLSAYVEVSAADATLTLGYNNGTTDADCTTTPTPSATVPATTGWTRFVCQTPVNTAISSIFVSSGTTAVTAVNVDGVQMVLGSTAVAFGNSNITFNGIFTSPIDIRNPNDNTTEFQVQDANSVNLLAIDSLNSIVSLGITGATAIAGTDNIGTGTGAAQTVNIGSTDGTGSVNISSGSGAINIGDDAGTEEIDIGGVTNTGIHAVKIGTNATDTGAITIGNNTAATAVSIDAGNTGLLQIGNSTAAHTIDIGDAGAAAGNAQNILIGSDTTTTASKLILDAGNNATASGTSGVIIGSATTDANQVNLQLDSSSSYTETASTCSTTVNQGAMYYNTASQSIRTCDVGGSWDDVLTTQGLGLMLFGILSDSGAAPGDLASLETAGVSGPCKVSWNSATTINISACTAYSGGRKVVVAAQAAVAITTTTADRWENVCLTGTSNQPALVGGGSGAAQTTAAIAPTFSLTAPILCLATIENGTATSGSMATGGEIYDTRTFIETTKEAVTATVADPIGDMAQVDGSGIEPSTGVGVANQEGVVVASNNTAVTGGVPDAIIATNGPAWVNQVFATASVLGDDVEAGAGGFAEAPNATFATANYQFIGVSHQAWTASTACASAITCQLSLFVNLTIGP